MYSFTHLILTGLACGLLGLLIGIISTRSLNPQERENRDLEEHLQKTEEKLSDYQQEMAEHFKQTALLVNNLTSSYKDIYNHLTNDAIRLGNIDINNPAIINNPQLAIKAKLEAGQPIEPPKDYAPKKDPDAPGTLSENYGLDPGHIKHKPAEEK
ncbi:MAG: DUF1043 family protein [Pseudomonadales bacterium]|nr:DUF1043 family protein [Pseudomonadales bacterium]